LLQPNGYNVDKSLERAREKVRSSVLILLLLLVVSLVIPARAQSEIQVIGDTASLTFPQSIQFEAEFRSGAEINSVVLEYGVDQLTCGTVKAKAFPDLTPAEAVKVEWTWEMVQSGSLAPGTTVWWRWQVSDAGGARFTTPTKTILWLDDTHPWQVISGGNINLHYYHGGDPFGQQLHSAAVQALTRLSQDVGVSTNSPVDIYIYASSDDLKGAILYEPSWVGGQAFPENNIIIIGIPPDQLDWGKNIEAHELSHVLVGHLTFSCLGYIPTWLNEGLATYSMGGPTSSQQALFDQAQSADDLPSLRSLTGGFPEASDLANLSYTVSYSVVNFLIKTYGRDKMTALLLALRDGQTADEALKAVYAFNVDGLESAWRLSIGLAPRAGSSEPTLVPTPTVVPTFVPVGAAPSAVAGLSTPLPTAQPTLIAQPAVTAVPSAGQPGIRLNNISTLLKFGLVCLVIVLILGGLAVFLILRRQNRSAK
jgi:hypothetical protein